MASVIYIKSLIWLVAAGGVGYGLMILTAPSEAKIAAIKERSTGFLTEEERKKALFMQKLQQAANETPIYMKKTKAE